MKVGNDDDFGFGFGFEDEDDEPQVSPSKSIKKASPERDDEYGDLDDNFDDQIQGS